MHSSNKVVQFSQLSAENKNQFLQFLAKNNIMFEMGQGTYSATVSLPKIAESDALRPRNTNTTKITNLKSNPKQACRSLTPVKKKSKPKCRVDNNDENHFDGIVSTPTVRKQHKTHQSVTPSKSETKVANVKTPNQHKDKENFVRLNVMNAGFKKACKPQDALKERKTFNKSNGVERKNQLVGTGKDSFELNDSLTGILKGFPNYRSPERRKIETVEKYFDSFSINLKYERPIKLPRAQLDKYIEEIYTKSFIRNTQLLQNKQFKTVFKSNKDMNNHFAKFIQKDFAKKFKSEKSIKFNLANLLYTLGANIHRQKQKIPLSLKIFEEFILGHYLYEDLIFFLFARNQVQKQLGLNFVEFAEKHRLYKPEQNPKLSMKLKEISRFLKCIIGKDSTMIDQYEEMIMQTIHTKYVNKNEIQDSINIYYLIKVLLDDYKQKRVIQEKQLQDTPQNKLNDTLRKLEYRSSNNNNQQLTFGQDTEENISHQNFLDDFWQCQDSDGEDFSIKKMAGSLQTQEFYQIIAEKLQKKATEFIQILVSEEDSIIKGRIEKLVSQKATLLLKTIFKMSKVKWFRELKIETAQVQDIERIQKMQLSLKSLRKNPNSKDIGQFCKQILTVKQVTQQIQKILV